MKMSADVDFDFFDTVPGNSGNSGNSKPPPLHNGSAKASNARSNARPGSSKKVSRRDSSDSDRDSDNARSKSVKKIEAKLPQTTNQSGDYSDSFEDSDDQRTGGKTPSPRSRNRAKGGQQSRPRSASTDESTDRSRSRSRTPEVERDQGSKKQAWGNSANGKSKKSDIDSRRRDSRSSAEGRTRPKTAAHKSQKDRKASLSDSETESSRCTDSESQDSDITDVSPIHSPRDRKQVSKSNLRVVHAKPPKSPGVAMQNPSRPRSAKSSGSTSAFTDLIKANQDTLDLKLLMQAVMELEDEKDGYQGRTGSGRVKPQFIVPSAQASSMPRKNFSFNNDQVRSIDKENQRLMQNILQKAVEGKQAKKKPRKPPPPDPNVVSRLTPSAVNRLREHKRIERDNWAMLQRLQHTQATKQLRREALLTDFDQKLVGGIPMSSIHPTGRKTPGKSPSPYCLRNTDSHSQSMTSIRTNSTAGMRSRPTSAQVKQRPSSAHQPVTTKGRPGSASKPRPTSAHVQSRPKVAFAQSDHSAWESGW